MRLDRISLPVYTLAAMILLALLTTVISCSVKQSSGCIKEHVSDNCHEEFGEVCFGCHKEFDKIAGFKSGMHTPFKQGDCAACHSPHGAMSGILLKSPFPKDFYLPYDSNNYSLCFKCHNEEIATEPTTYKLTKFRNGGTNLHYSHVNDKPKGISCKMCHSFHSGMPPVNTPFWWENMKSWKEPFSFKKTQTGWSCDVGCHQTMYYDRINPVK